MNMLRAMREERRVQVSRDIGVRTTEGGQEAKGSNREGSKHVSLGDGR